MPIVNGRSDLIADKLLGENSPNPERAQGYGVCATGTVLNAATDLLGSTYLLARLPSDCILDSRTAFHVADWGYADIRIGTKSDPAALASVLKTAGNTVSPVADGDVAKHGKPLWQVLGMAEDPTGDIGIYAHGIANAAAAGSMLFSIHYLYRG